MPLKATCELRYFPAERALISKASDRHAAPQAITVLSGNGVRWTSTEFEGPPRAAVGSRQLADEA